MRCRAVGQPALRRDKAGTVPAEKGGCGRDVPRRRDHKDPFHEYIAQQDGRHRLVHPLPGATTSALALRKHWLQDEFAQGGTVLRSLSDAASRDIRLAYYHHGQSGLLREGANVPAIWARASGQQAVVVGITWVDEYQGILSLAGGKVRDLSDLKGRRLGLPLRRPWAPASSLAWRRRSSSCSNTATCRPISMCTTVSTRHRCNRRRACWHRTTIPPPPSRAGQPTRNHTMPVDGPSA